MLHPHVIDQDAAGLDGLFSHQISCITAGGNSRPGRQANILVPPVAALIENLAGEPTVICRPDPQARFVAFIVPDGKDRGVGAIPR